MIQFCQWWNLGHQVHLQKLYNFFLSLSQCATWTQHLDFQMLSRSLLMLWSNLAHLFYSAPLCCHMHSILNQFMVKYAWHTLKLGRRLFSNWVGYKYLHVYTLLQNPLWCFLFLLQFFTSYVCFKKRFVKNNPNDKDSHYSETTTWQVDMPWMRCVLQCFQSHNVHDVLHFTEAKDILDCLYIKKKHQK